MLALAFLQQREARRRTAPPTVRRFSFYDVLEVDAGEKREAFVAKLSADIAGLLAASNKNKNPTRDGIVASKRQRVAAESDAAGKARATEPGAV